MRINVYSQELTSEVVLISKESDGSIVTGIQCMPNGEPNLKGRVALSGFERDLWEKAGRTSDLLGLTNPLREIHEEPIIYHAARLMLHSSPMLHHPPMDDDRSAITFWLPKSPGRREEMARAFEELAKIFRSAPRETGLD